MVKGVCGYRGSHVVTVVEKC